MRKAALLAATGLLAFPAAASAITPAQRIAKWAGPGAVVTDCHPHGHHTTICHYAIPAADAGIEALTPGDVAGTVESCAVVDRHGHIRGP